MCDALLRESGLAVHHGPTRVLLTARAHARDRTCGVRSRPRGDPQSCIRPTRTASEVEAVLFFCVCLLWCFFVADVLGVLKKLGVSPTTRPWLGELSCFQNLHTHAFTRLSVCVLFGVSVCDVCVRGCGYLSVFTPPAEIFRRGVAHIYIQATWLTQPHNSMRRRHPRPIFRPHAMPPWPETFHWISAV